MKAILTYVMSITQPRKDPSLQPCITALDNWWSLEEIYNTSSHHVHIASHHTYFFLNYANIGILKVSLQFFFTPHRLGLCKYLEVHWQKKWWKWCTDLLSQSRSYPLPAGSWLLSVAFLQSLYRQDDYAGTHSVSFHHPMHMSLGSSTNSYLERAWKAVRNLGHVYRNIFLLKILQHSRFYCFKGPIKWDGGCCGHTTSIYSYITIPSI